MMKTLRWLVPTSALSFALVVSAQNAPGTPNAQAGDAADLQEVVVTGSRLQPGNGFTTPTPVTVLGADVINQRAAADLSDVIRDLPQVVASSGSAGASRAGNNAGENYIQIRALPQTETLVLIDGIRTAGSSAQGPFDINMIPTNLVERIELVTGGASAAYGSDAVAGVANIILKNKFEGISGNFQGGISKYSDDKQYSGGLAFGKNFWDNRGNIMFGIDAEEHDGLGPFYSRPFGRQEPGLISYGPAGGPTRPAGTPAQGFANGVELGNNTPGGIITAGPLAGIAFDNSGNPYTTQRGPLYSGSVANSNFNYGDNASSFYNVNTPFNRVSMLARGTLDVTDDVKATLEAIYGHTSANNLQGVLNTSTVVSINNPYLPAAIKTRMTALGLSTITVGRTDSDLGAYQAQQDNNYLRFVGGLSGKIFNNWSWDANYQQSSSQLRGTFQGYRTADINAAFGAVTDANGSAVCGTVAGATPGCVPFNIFGSGNASAAALAYLRQYTQGFLATQEQNTAALNLRGEPISLWAGPLSTAVGIEWRREYQQQVPEDANATALNGSFTQQNYPAFHSQRFVKEGYTEVNLPLARQLRLVNALDLNGAFRYTNYSDSGGVDTWKVGLTYKPDEQLLFRATRSRDIRAPTLFEEYGTGATSVFAPTANPFTGGSDTPLFHKGPNTTLVPERAYTSTIGVTAQPNIAQGLRLSADYFTINISGVITPLFPLDLINGCYRGIASYCSQITFDSGMHMLSVTQVLINLNRQRQSGFDFELDYRLPVNVFGGNLSLRSLATRTIHDQTTDATGLVTENAGYAVQPVWKTTTNLTYALTRFSTTATLNTFSSIKYSTTVVGPDDTSYSATAVNSINQNKFPGAQYLEWSAQYEIPMGNLKQFQIYGDINNVLDKQPPQYAYQAFVASAGANPRETYDFIGRYMKLGVRFKY